MLEPLCITPGCLTPASKRRRCLVHYRVWKHEHGHESCYRCHKITRDAHVSGRRNGRVLTIDGIKRVTCRRHLPDLLNEYRAENLEHLGKLIDIDPLADEDKGEDCWVLNTRNTDGYSYITPAHCSQQVYGHHLSYGLFIGGWTDTQQLHHRCQRPACVNPAHLQALPPKRHQACATSKPTTKPVPSFIGSPGHAMATEFAHEYGLPFRCPLEALEELTAA